MKTSSVFVYWQTVFACWSSTTLNKRYLIWSQIPFIAILVLKIFFGNTTYSSFKTLAKFGQILTNSSVVDFIFPASKQTPEKIHSEVKKTLWFLKQYPVAYRLLVPWSLLGLKITLHSKTTNTEKHFSTSALKLCSSFDCCYSFIKIQPA